MRGTAMSRTEAGIAQGATYPTAEGLRIPPFITRPLTGMIAGPYAQRKTITTEQATWREGIAVRWVQGHLLLALIGLVVSAGLMALSSRPEMGIAFLFGSFVALGLCALALRLIDHRLTHIAVNLTLLVDLLASGVALFAFGPHLALCALIPGSLLIAALLVDRFLIVTGGAVAFLAYMGVLALSMAGVLRPALALSPTAELWVEAGVATAGMGLLLWAIWLVMGQHRQALAHEAALDYLLKVHERRASAHRVAIDADSIALQTALTKTFRGAIVPPVTTCEELAPMAHMVNATTSRLPGLLRDREERLRLEKAIRDLAGVLETAWAGFDWSWPSPTGTALDRLITVLRPARAQTDAS